MVNNYGESYSLKQLHRYGFNRGDAMASGSDKHGSGLLPTQSFPSN